MKKKLKSVKQGSLLRLHTALGDMGGCGMIRVMLPYLFLSQFNNDHKIKITPTYDMSFNLDPKYYKNLPFYQFQRSATEGQLQMMRIMKSHISSKTGMKMVYEIDDSVTDIPKWNYAHQYYIQYQDSIKKFFEEVDFIVCSTEKLAKNLSSYNKTKVIPNRLSFPWFSIQKKETISSHNKKILWAGSQNHFSVHKDKKGGDFGDKLLKYIKETKNKYEWIFVGAMPNELKNEGLTHYKWVNYLNFPSFLQSLDADIGIAPLEQIPFNESKSNIKTLEFTALGIPGVYTNIEPYKNMHRVSDNDEQMIDHIESLLIDEKCWHQTRDLDYQTLKNELYWDDDYCRFYLNTYLKEIGKKL